MKRIFVFSIVSLCSVLSLFSCAQTSHEDPQSPALVLVGSTPGDSLVAAMLDISPKVTIDFIRWELILHAQDMHSGKYEMHLNFGEGKPNTRGFMNNGFRQSDRGTFDVMNTELSSFQGEVYSFKDESGKARWSAIRLTDKLFHLLTPDGKLMVGNGGWSYSLHVKEPSGDNRIRFRHSRSVVLFQDTIKQVTFDGRTACQEFIQGYGLPPLPDCIKLKWRIIFHRDRMTNDAGTYSMRKVRPIADPHSTMDHALHTISGTWTQKKGMAGHPEMQFYQLTPGTEGQILNLVPGDENVLFFLDAEQQPLIGNEDFGFALNRIER